MTVGKGKNLIKGSDVAVICAGPMANRAREAAENLKTTAGWNPSIYNIRYIKPVDTDMLEEIGRTHGTVITIEDGTVIGGLHGTVAEYMSENMPAVKVVPVGIPDRFINQGSQEELHEECGLTIKQIQESIMAEYRKMCKD